ncbi:tRNA (5-methylaminomethyl-2-thiouridine)(34)-methyltransferase MnmD [Arenibacter latericius]|uniref:tRNA (5-methylaminomethyl-2-thiouridine)(34)-methyltransferase MnmD n=1 Tax=Arenibacter latericius TaxID=86104 RepID=UPI00041C6962|nr:tRNA (5-methylaminomethyl-2-thiouridine)(34)-methyltransferase MnmD [Arenibacter latericius]
MKRRIITTADGSKTIQIEDWNEQYHSTHGAIQEAYHVFIKNGLSLFKNQDLSILEIGFGTGLNSFITFLEADKYGLKIYYNGVEAFPVQKKELTQLDYSKALKADQFEQQFLKMHQIPWEAPHDITDNFCLLKQKMDFRDIAESEKYNLIYFDAFGSRVQPELWTEDIFRAMYNTLKINGVLVTYAAKGSVRRAMQTVGFTVERLPGPPGKREMLRAKKEE